MSPTAQPDSSQAAQVVLDAAIEAYWMDEYEARVMITAALRSLAKQSMYADVSVTETAEVVRVDHILNVAAELELPWHP